MKKNGSVAAVDKRAEDLILSMIPEYFQINPQGEIWRHATRTNKGKREEHEPRRAEYESKGYKRVRVSVNGIRIRVSAHRLVYRYFAGDIPEDKEVDHMDTNRHNNCPSNLRLLTRKGNERAKKRKGK